MTDRKKDAVAKGSPKSAALTVPHGAKGTSVLARLAVRFGVEPNKMMECLKATAFKGTATNEQIMALCIVSDQYRLNPWTKEIFAFPDKNNGIIPVVSVDGWSRIINEHAQFDGMEFEGDGESCTCSMYRKDRSHPVTVTEYMDECKRNTGPWGSHPRRMLRHKAMIQAARLAFGYGGIYDADEAERIRDATGDTIIGKPDFDMPKEAEPEPDPDPVEVDENGEVLPAEELPY